MQRADKWHKPQKKQTLKNKAMKNKKNVPQKWYNETINFLARECMDAWLKFGHDSEERKQAWGKRNEFKESFNPVKELKGNVQAAKLEIKLNEPKIRQFTDIKDKYDPYNFITTLAGKYFLCDYEVRQLFDFAGKMNLLY